nr:MAG TPA: NikA, BACTERIAL CONJUGATION, RELAXASE, DNA [Caudoviricetes sp.]
MSRKIEDGRTPNQRYRENKATVTILTTPEKAQDIKDCAALAGLSITQYLLMCHENYQRGDRNR